MRKSGQSIVAVVVLLLVIAIAVAFVIKAAIPERHPRRVADWTCEACDHRFVDKAQSEPRVCPECGGEAVLTYYYYCSVHDHLFEAYRSKPDSDADPMRMPPGMGVFHKLPGGEWTREEYLGESVGRITCPEGNSDYKTLRYCPPGDEKRQ